MKRKIKQILNKTASTLTILVMVAFSNIFYFPVFAVENLTARCSVEPLAINIGERAIWRVLAEGGDGNYEYQWSGSDDLIGNTSSVGKFYSRSGTKNATVTVYSEGQIVTPTCSLIVLDTFQTLTGSCFTQSSILRESDRVDWRVEAFGGDGRYEFSWSGTDDLRGSGSGISRPSQIIR